MGLRYHKRVGNNKGWGLNISRSGLSSSYRSKYGSIGRKGFSIKSGIPGFTFRSGWGRGKNKGFEGIIVLTHYSHFIRNFMERGMNDDFTISFIEISQNNTTSFLRRIESNLFTETAYDKVFSKIQSFINRESEVDIRADLRPFLESLYLPHFYIREFKVYAESDTPFGTLSEKIDAIFSDETVKAKFHEFRTMLNPDSHLFTSSNEEDIRSFAGEMMDYLYKFSHNTSTI